MNHKKENLISEISLNSKAQVHEFVHERKHQDTIHTREVNLLTCKIHTPPQYMIETSAAYINSIIEI